MGQEKHWHLVCYDIRDPKRWRKAYKKLKGRGDRIQYSIFRVHATRTQLENLRLALRQVMADEDDVMIVRLCPGCAQRVIDTRGKDGWIESPSSFEVF